MTAPLPAKKGPLPCVKPAINKHRRLRNDFADAVLKKRFADARNQGLQFNGLDNLRAFGLTKTRCRRAPVAPGNRW
jgi:hypothetical protein